MQQSPCYHSHFTERETEPWLQENLLQSWFTAEPKSDRNLSKAHASRKLTVFSVTFPGRHCILGGMIAFLAIFIRELYLLLEISNGSEVFMHSETENLHTQGYFPQHLLNI